MMEINAPEKEVKKHAAAIHCSNTLSLLQRKISNVLLYYAYKELLQKEEHVISVSELCKILAINTHNYDALKQALKALVQTVLEWNLVDDKTGAEDWSATTVLASVRIKGGSCYYAYSPRMRDLLYSPSIYGKINLVIQSRFKSSYALALYENCVRYKKIGGTKWFEMEEFRKIMGVIKTQYHIFRDLKRRVIDKALEEVNTYSDIIVAAEYKKTGRKVQSLKFLVKERARKPRLNQKELKEDNKKTDLENNIIYHQLIHDFGIKSQTAKLLLEEYNVEYIQEKIQLTLTSDSFKLGKINDLSGYLISSIRHDYQKSVSVQEFIANKTESQDTQVEEKRSTQRSLVEQRKAYSGYIQKAFIHHLETLSLDLKNTIINEWLNNLENLSSFMSKRIKRLYNECGFTHPQVFSDFKDFMYHYYPKYYPILVQFDAFCQ